MWARASELGRFYGVYVSGSISMPFTEQFTIKREGSVLFPLAIGMSMRANRGEQNGSLSRGIYHDCKLDQSPETAGFSLQRWLTPVPPSATQLWGAGAV